MHIFDPIIGHRFIALSLQILKQQILRVLVLNRVPYLALTNPLKLMEDSHIIPLATDRALDQ